MEQFYQNITAMNATADNDDNLSDFVTLVTSAFEDTATLMLNKKIDKEEVATRRAALLSVVIRKLNACGFVYTGRRK